MANHDSPFSPEGDPDPTQDPLKEMRPHSLLNDVVIFPDGSVTWSDSEPNFSRKPQTSPHGQSPGVQPQKPAPQRHYHHHCYHHVYWHPQAQGWRWFMVTTGVAIASILLLQLWQLWPLWATSDKISPETPSRLKKL